LNLLFDQNISPRIINHLASVFPEAKQVRQVGLEDASDALIFEFARNNNFAIVIFDSDFVDLNIVRGIPPKIIWIRTGNLTTRSVAELLNRNIELIKRFLESDQPEHQILEIIKDDL
jgi:predicted nuclease of predicted toxin-antitoxin system